MSYDQKTAERVRRVLAGRNDIIEIKMMGGLTFMVNGNMCCGISRNSLMVRVGPGAYPAALSQPHVTPLEFGGKAPIGYIRIHPDGYQTAESLAGWIQRGLDFVATLPAKKSRAKPAASKKHRG